MIITHATINDIKKAIKEINIRYDNNLMSSTITNISIYEDILKLKINLLVIDTKNKGGRNCYTHRINPFACFHAYYDFFNKLIEINPKAIIMTSIDWIIKLNFKTGKIIGNPIIRDKNRINRIRPSSYMCKCNKKGSVK